MGELLPFYHENLTPLVLEKRQNYPLRINVILKNSDQIMRYALNTHTWTMLLSNEEHYVLPLFPHNLYWNPCTESFFLKVQILPPKPYDQ